jgi:acetyltransferase-like isoleucine patch superfamily enzyme
MKSNKANYNNNVLIEKDTPLTNEEKDMFAYFGENVKIRPPFRILNPHLIHVGDKTSIREGAFIHAYTDLSYLLNSIEPRFRKDFSEESYKYTPEIYIGREIQVGRFLLLSCTKKVTIEDYVVISERAFIGDNNHTFSHPEVPILFQPNKAGEPVNIGTGSWIGIGAAILGGTILGKNCVVGANSVVQGEFPSHAVIAIEKSKMLFRRNEE